MIIKICEHEMNEIEVCSDCYLSSCLKKDNYFCEPCTVPHPLVWAKLKGFPFWPAKALREVDGQVDVRFFGQHDRAWVPANCCYMMSKDIPFAIKKRKGGFENAMQEMDLHIENIRRVHKNWEYAPYRMPYDPSNTYIHNYLKNKPNSINGESNDASTPKVGKIKIRIKRESGKSTLTLESGSSNLGGVKDKSIDEDSKDNVGESIMKNSKSKDEVCKKSPQLAAGNAKSTEIKTECSPDSTTEKSPNSRKSNLESVDVSTKTVSRSKMEMSNDVPTVDDAHITKVLSLKTSGTDTTSKDVNKLADEANMDTSAVPETENEKQLSESKHIKESSKNSSKEPAPSILPTKLPSLSNLEGATTPPRIETPGTPPMKLTPVSDKFAIHLDRTIESCKASLGIKETDNLDEMETEDRDSDSDCLSMHCETSSENSDWEHEEQGEEREEEEESNKAKEGNHEVVSKQPSDEDTTKKIESVDVKVDESPESENVDRKVKKIDSPSIDEVKKSKIAKLDDHMTKSPDKKNENKSKNEEKNHLDVQITETQNKNKKETVQHQSVNSAPKIDNNPHNIKVAANSSNNTTKTSPVKFSARLAEKAAQKSVDEVTSLESDGPVSAKDGLLHQQSTAKKKTDFKKYTDKIVDYIEGTFQEFYSEVLEGSDKMVDDIPTATVGSKTKNLELEMMQWKHQSEIKHIAELTVAEIREGLLQEKNNAIADVKKDLAVEKEKAIKETKKKQWCAYCGKEAIFYCCWNTSYCDYPCQQTHWKEHMNVCTQATNSGTPTDQTDYDTQVRTAVSIQQSPEVNAKSGEIPVTQPSGVLVTQPMQVKYIRQTLPQPTTSIHGQQVVVRTPVTAYNTMQLGPMNTLTRAPTTIVQQRPIIQHTNYPVLRPQGGFPQGVATQIVPATQGMPTQLVMPHASTVQSAAAAAAPVQLRNIVSYSQSRPV
ncbi:MYND-type zinc finger-containing chromatin reader ZMYND8-like [Saccoglossus kowalevskii]